MTWTNDGTQVETVEIPSDETACAKDMYLLVGHEFDSWSDAMHTCKKLSMAGYNDSDFETMEEYREFYEKLTEYPESSLNF